jgi:hypothetical protein
MATLSVPLSLSLSL